MRRAIKKCFGRRILAATAEVWIIARWLGLKLIVVLVQSIRQKASDTERLIRLGEVFFPNPYPADLFDSYASYVRHYPADLEPYHDLFNSEQWCSGTVVDLGSGLGQYSTALHALGASSIIRVEYQYEKTVWSASNLSAPGVVHVTASAEDLPLRSGVADMVFSHTVFEHLPSVTNGLKECARALRNGGRLVLSFNFLHHMGGHHLFPYVTVPWATWMYNEKQLCAYWSRRLEADQNAGRMGFFKQCTILTSLSDGAEVHLNRMTYPDFERVVAACGFVIDKRLPSGSIIRLFPALEKVPHVGLFLTGTVFYVLRKKVNT